MEDGRKKIDTLSKHLDGGFHSFIGPFRRRVSGLATLKRRRKRDNKVEGSMTSLTRHNSGTILLF